MGEALLGGSALAAFLAGTVAFFAPCCATVMVPSYLSATVGARRWRIVPLTGLYIAGVATVVWPLTLGAAGLASLLNRYHAILFVVGGLMMIAVGVATLRGWMFSMPLPNRPASTDATGVFLLGVFAGAATACCAPVLAGAVAIAGVSADWWVGGLLGGIYLLGLITPLLAAAAGAERVRRRLHDPAVSIEIAGRTLRTTRMRLIGGVAFVVLGLFVIGLALTGQAQSAPGAQAAFGRWLTGQASWLADQTPFAVGWALVLAFAAAVAVVALRSIARHHESGEAEIAAGQERSS